MSATVGVASKYAHVNSASAADPRQDGSTRRIALSKFGEISSVEIGGWPPVTVRFTTHAAALNAKRAAAELKHIAGGLDTLYNERPYDDRGW